jgi:hypothetical protein
MVESKSNERLQKCLRQGSYSLSMKLLRPLAQYLVDLENGFVETSQGLLCRSIQDEQVPIRVMNMFYYLAETKQKRYARSILERLGLTQQLPPYQKEFLSIVEDVSMPLTGFACIGIMYCYFSSS